MAKKDKITVIVLDAFQDKYDHKTQYPVGKELTVDTDRANDLVSRGLAKVKEQEAPKEPKVPKVPKAAESTEKKEETTPPSDNPDTV